MFLNNRYEPTIPVVQLEMDEELSEEGNYNHMVSQAEPRVVRRNDPDIEIDRDGSMYNKFLGAKPPSLSRSPKPVEIMDWIFEMEMVFESYNSSNKQKTVFAVSQLKNGVLSWLKLLADTMPWGKALRMSWEAFME